MLSNMRTQCWQARRSRKNPIEPIFVVGLRGLPPCKLNPLDVFPHRVEERSSGIAIP